MTQALYWLGLLVFCAILGFVILTRGARKSWANVNDVAELNNSLQQLQNSFNNLYAQMEDWQKSHNDWAIAVRGDDGDTFNAQRIPLKTATMQELATLRLQLKIANDSARRAEKILQRFGP